MSLHRRPSFSLSAPAAGSALGLLFPTLTGGNDMPAFVLKLAFLFVRYFAILPGEVLEKHKHNARAC